MANIADQTKSAQVNSFTGGINTDLHPLLQPNNTLTDCVNGTLITYNGNENMLQNDMGNFALTGAKLPTNYVPIGMKEHAGILYVVAYNPVEKRVQLGSYPSPKVSSGYEHPQAEVQIQPFEISGHYDEDYGFNPMDILRHIEEGDLEEKNYLYSTILESAENAIHILGAENNSQYYLTVNDQFNLEVSCDSNDEIPWIQKLKFFTVSENGTLEDITDTITEYLNNKEGSDEFNNVIWQSPGWIGVKYEMLHIDKSSQYIGNVSYPKLKRLGKITFEKQTEESATGVLTSENSFYESPYIMLHPKDGGDKFTKCYWQDVIPNDTHKIIYYSDAVWEIKPDIPCSTTKYGLWTEVLFDTNVEDISSVFEKYNGKFLYMFLPKLAGINNFDNVADTSKTDVSICIAPSNDREFNIETRELQFLNAPAEMPLSLGSTYVKELYCHGNGGRISFADSVPRVHTVYGDWSDSTFRNINWINVVSDLPCKEDVSEEITAPNPYMPEEEVTTFTRQRMFTAPRSSISPYTIEYTLINDDRPLEIDHYDLQSDEYDYEIGKGVLTFYSEVTQITNNMFENCTQLKSITLPDSVKDIMSGAFAGCISLESAVLGTGVEVISDIAFMGCSSLKSIIIPDSVYYIGSQAFDGCSGLQSMTIGSGIVSFGTCSFRNCTGQVIINCNMPDGWMFCEARFAEIVISEGVTSIGTHTFRQLSDVESIVLPSTITAFGTGAFEECTGELIAYCDIPSAVAPEYGAFFNANFSRITLEEGVTSIGDYAFYQCSGVSSVTIANSVQSIGLEAFLGCWGDLVVHCNIPDTSYGAFRGTDFTMVTIGKDVSIIGDRAFYKLPALSTVDIQGNVLRVGHSAFYECNITEIHLPMVEEIGDYAFYNCSDLTTITIPDNVNFLGPFIFKGCSSLPMNNGLCYVNSFLVSADRQRANFTLKANTRYIGAGAFSGCSLVSQITLPDTVIAIGNEAFQGCSSLTTINIPEGVLTIGEYAFRNCTVLKNITLPENVKIGGNAFTGCSNFPVVDGIRYVDFYVVEVVDKEITSCHFKEGTRIIGAQACSNCQRLVDVYFPDSVTTIGDGAFEYCTALLGVTLGSGITTIGKDAFANCRELSAVGFQNNISYIGSGAFYACGKLLNIYINDISAWCKIAFESYSANPLSTGASLYGYSGLITAITLTDDVTSIGDYAFYKCTQLINVELSDSVTTIGDYAFGYCSSLTSVTIPDSVKSIGKSAFEECTNFTSITIPDSVTTIGGRAFAVCYNVDNVIIPSSVQSIGDNAFLYCNGKLDLDIYNVGGLYGGEFSHLVIGNNTAYISKNAFSNCKTLETIVLGENIKGIGENAFFGCTGRVTILHKEIPSSAFANASFSEVVLGDAVTTIGSRAFQNCSTIFAITFGPKVAKIGEYAFSGNTALKEVHVADVGAWCNIEFYDYSSNPTYYSHTLHANNAPVTHLVIPKGTTEIKPYAFYFCADIKQITIPDTVTVIGKYAFCKCGFTQVSIPPSVQNIGRNALPAVQELHIYDLKKWCNIGGLSYIMVSDMSSTRTKLYLCGVLQDYLLIPHGVTKINPYVFSYFQFSAVSIPDTVQEIGVGAFYYSSIGNIIVGQGISKICDSAFYSSNITNICFKTSKDSIEMAANCFYATPPSICVDSKVYGSWSSYKNIAQIPGLLNYGTVVYRFFSQNVPTINVFGGTIESALGEYVIRMDDPDNFAVIAVRADVKVLEQLDNAQNPTFIKSCNTFFTVKYKYIDSAQLIVLHEDVKSVNIQDSYSTKIAFTGGHKYELEGAIANKSVFVCNLKNWLESTFTYSTRYSTLSVNGELQTDLVVPENTDVSKWAIPATLDLRSLRIESGCNLKSFSTMVSSPEHIFICPNVTIESNGMAIQPGADSMTSIEAYSCIDNSVIDDNVSASIRITPEYWRPWLPQAKNAVLTAMYKNVYMTGKDNSVLINNYGTVNSVKNGEGYVYLFPESWKNRGVGNEASFYTYDLACKNTSAEEIVHYYPKYCHNVLTILDSTHNAVIKNIGWTTSQNDDGFGEITIYNYSGESLSSYTFRMEIVKNGHWGNIGVKPFELINKGSSGSEYVWTLWNDVPSSQYLTYTADNLVFDVYSSIRVQQDVWKDSYKKNLKCAIAIKGFVGDKEYITDVLDSSDIKCTKVGKFYDLSNKFEFVGPIPETFTKLEIQSVFYCIVEDKVVIFDQTLQKDILYIPEYASTDYSNIAIEKFKYIPEPLVNDARNVRVVFETSSVVDGSALECTLSDYSGNFLLTGRSSGLTTEHEILFEDVPKGVQLANFSVLLEGQSLINSTIILHTIVSKYTKDNMSTISPEYIINKILSSPDVDKNEWPFNVRFVSYGGGEVKYGKYSVQSDNNYELSDFVERSSPAAKDVAIVNSAGYIPMYEGQSVADMHYMPVKLELSLGDNIKLYGNVSDYTSTFIDGLDKSKVIRIVNTGKEFRTWEKTGKFLTSINKLVLRPSSETTSEVPKKKRLLKHFYRPIQFKKIMKKLGYENKIELFDDYWTKNCGLVGRRDSDLIYECRDTKVFDVAVSDQNSLKNFEERLPVILPVHFKNEDSKGWYGINMPTALKGASSLTTSTWCDTDRYGNSLMKHLRAWKNVVTPFDGVDTETSVVSMANKTKNLWTLAVNTNNEDNPIRYTWMYDTALWTEEEFLRVEKFMFLAGLAITQSSGIQLHSNDNLYFAEEPKKSDYINHILSKISGQCSNVQYSYYGITGNLYNFNFDARINAGIDINSMDTPYLAHFIAELNKYRHAKTHDYDNAYLQGLAAMLSTDWWKLNIPEVSKGKEVKPQSVKLRRGVYDRRDGNTGPVEYPKKYFWSKSYEYISAQNGYETVKSPEADNRWNKFKLESITKKTGGNESPDGGKMYPWPIRAESTEPDIFCQIFKTANEKFVNNKDMIKINGIEESVDAWLLMYLKELIEELEYEKDYNTED